MGWTRGQVIGRGSSATVSLATSQLSGDVFAVKSVELAQSEFLQREQKILSSLSSPYVVGYRGADITRENNKLMYNLRMEYVADGTLSDAIHRHGGRLDQLTIGIYAYQIVQGLEYLHSVGLAHCDIKGNNILVGEQGAKIGDLGCAKWIDPMSRVTGTINRDVEAMVITGTPVFMAPEAASGREQGLPADIWALGCTVIEMATGAVPWHNAADPVSVLYRIAFSGELPKFPACLSDQAKDFLSKCLKRDPKERWTASQLLKHPFLAEFHSHAKKIEESHSKSPTSILDQDFWDSADESACPGSLSRTSESNSPSGRIGRLSSFYRVPSWEWDDSWITIRSSNNGVGDDLIDVIEARASTICGSVEASTSHGTAELEISVFGENSLNLSDRKFSCRMSRGVLVGCNDIKDSVVLNNLNIERDKVTLLLQPQVI